VFERVLPGLERFCPRWCCAPVDAVDIHAMRGAPPRLELLHFDRLRHRRALALVCSVEEEAEAQLVDYFKF